MAREWDPRLLARIDEHIDQFMQKQGISHRNDFMQADVIRFCCSPELVQPEQLEPFAKLWEQALLADGPEKHQLFNRMGKNLHLEREAHQTYNQKEARLLLFAACLTRLSGGKCWAKAATAVREYKTGVKLEPPATDTLTMLHNLALSRVERHALGRLTGALVQYLRRNKPLPPGAIVKIFVDAKSPTLDTKNAFWTWVANERGELVMPSNPSSKPPKPLMRDAYPIQYMGHTYTLVVGIPGKERVDFAEPRDKDLVDHLLHAMATPYLKLRDETLKLLAKERKQAADAGRGNRLPERDLMLWLAARLACLLASPDAPEKAHAVIYRPGPAGAMYQLVTSSDLQNVHSRENMPTNVSEGMMLSGFSSALHMSLGLQDTKSPYSQLVSFHQEELQSLAADERPPSCYAVPFPMQGDTLAPVLYVWTARVDDDRAFQVRFTALKLLAPVLGEILWRARDTRSTLGALEELLTTEVHEPAAFEQRLAARLGPLLAEAAGMNHWQDLRLAMVLLRSKATKKTDPYRAVAWMSEQLTQQAPGVMMAPWLVQNPAARQALPFLYGRLPLQRQESAVVLFIPMWLDRDQLDHLRAAVATRLNGLKAGWTGSEQNEILRVQAWVVDFRADRLPKTADATAGLMCREIEGTAQQLNLIVETYRLIRQGDFGKAKKEAMKAPQNPYLLRRAAEAALSKGDPEAADLARLARKADPASVRAYCLYGDALLAQGKLFEAVSAYDAAIMVDGRHVMPHYHKGQALLLSAQVLLDFYHHVIDVYIDTGKLDYGAVFGQVAKFARVPVEDGEVPPAAFRWAVMGVVQGLSDQALNALNHAWGLLLELKDRPGERPLSTDGDARLGGVELSCFASIAQVLRLQNPSSDQGDLLDEFTEKLGDYGEMLAHRERQFGKMQLNWEVIMTLLQELAKPKTLKRLGISLPRARSGR